MVEVEEVCKSIDRMRFFDEYMKNIVCLFVDSMRENYDSGGIGCSFITKYVLL